MKNLEKKLTFCEELEKNVEVLEGSLSRTKGFIILSFLRTLDFMKTSDIPISQVKLYISTKVSLQKQAYKAYKSRLNTIA